MSRSLLARAEHALLEERRDLDAEELTALSMLPAERIPALAALAHDVRVERCGTTVEVEGILSAKTGGCPEDCHFCSQSSRFDTPVRPTAILDLDEIRAAASETARLGASEFCIVAAVRGPDERLIDRVLEATSIVKEEMGLNVAASLGILTADQAARLASGGVHRYNHNLETARSFFPRIVSTHSWQERFDTCTLVRDAGMELCCGMLLGMGESDAQRIEMLVDLRAVTPAEVPLNFLNPRPGTPLADQTVLAGSEALKTVAAFRLALPRTILRFAGGREITLGDLGARQGMLGGINAIIVGNYLTTLGRPADRDIQMLDELQMPIKALGQTL